MSASEEINCCFGCGAGNAQGMHLPFERDDAARKIRGRFSLGEQFQGAPGFIHGGIIATVLDEVMSKVNLFRGVTAVTAELSVKYFKPVRVGQQLIVEGFEIRQDGRNLFYEGEIRDPNGQILASGTGRFVEIDRERFGISTDAKHTL